MSALDPRTVQCWEVYDYFRVNAAHLRDAEFHQTFLTPHCRFKKAGLRGSHLRILQVPSEIARFLCLMAEWQIGSYLEVGTSTGGSWFLTDSYLRAVNPLFGRSTGYDRTQKLRGWAEYRTRFPRCEFRRQNSAAIQLGDEHYDLAFIDARHEELWVWHDFERVRSHARFVAFHDIVLPLPSTVSKFWQVAKHQYPSWEIIDTMLPVMCGIGILQLS